MAPIFDAFTGYSLCLAQDGCDGAANSDDGVCQCWVKETQGQAIPNL